MRRLLSIVSSGPGDWVRLAQGYVWLIRARRVIKRAHGDQWLFSGNRSEAAKPETTAVSDEQWTLIRRRVRAVSRASRYPVTWAYCLQKSLALREWLAKDGIVTQVRYGIRKSHAGFDAHAWVVFDGKIINDSLRHVSTFAPLLSIDEYGDRSRGQIADAIVTSRTESDGAANRA